MQNRPFEKLLLSSALEKVICDLGYLSPTPIQIESIPILLAGRDLIGQSKTGSGKTAAFSIPILERIETGVSQIQALVIAPSRELCQQVAREMRRLGRYRTNLRVVLLTGGHPVYHDKRALEHGCHIVVGTPGRLLDHLKRKTISLSGLRTLVLDEADRMLDMGFIDSIEAILKYTPERRQTVLFSATFPPTIESLSRRYQRSPERATIEESETVDSDIEQLWIGVADSDKPRAVSRIVLDRSFDSVLVFCNLKTRVDELVRFLQKAGVSADGLHGDLEQRERETVMAKFRNHSVKVLVSTDVSARGIDISGLDAVINCDLPSDSNQYIHRIGRTGRAGRKGCAISLVCPGETAKIRKIEALLGRNVIVGRLENLDRSPKPTVARKMETISIAAGRKEKLRAGDILGALTGELGVSGDHVGKIEILDRVSFVAIDRTVSRSAFAALRSGKVKGRRFVVQLLSNPT